MKLLIRKATNKDIISIANHNQAMAWETESLEIDLETTIDGATNVLIDSNKGFYIVADLGGKVVGNLMITYEWSDWRNGFVWWIQSVYINPSFRKQGIFSALYNHVKSLAESEKVLELRLYVFTENTSAQKVYEAIGMNKEKYKIYSIKL